MILSNVAVYAKMKMQSFVFFAYKQFFWGVIKKTQSADLLVLLKIFEEVSLIDLNFNAKHVGFCLQSEN